jgi:hypothetical protein
MGETLERKVYHYNAQHRIDRIDNTTSDGSVKEYEIFAWFEVRAWQSLQIPISPPSIEHQLRAA